MPLGLALVDGHFGDQLVCRDAYGTGDVVTRNHLFANPRPNGARTPPPQQRPGNVHIAFIDRYLFDTIGDPTEHFLENADATSRDSSACRPEGKCQFGQSFCALELAMAELTPYWRAS